MRNIIFIIFIQLCSIGLYSQDDARHIDEGFKDLTRKYGNVGVSAAYSMDGLTKWKSYKGYSDRDSKTSFTDTTRTRIASIVKLWTAIGIMQLVENGKISLDNNVSSYIDGFPQKEKRPITVKHLLTHTSGIAGYKNSKEVKSTKEYESLDKVVEVFSARKLKFEPGSGFLYTSYGYVTLGLIIENVSGMSYEDYITKNILEIAGMHNTAIEKYGVSYENKSEIYHMQKGKVITPKQNNLSNRIPAGGYYSTVEDLMKFGNAVVANKLISEESLKEMLIVGYRSEGNPYGLGWQLYGPEGNEHIIIGHGGAQYGANTQLFIIPRLESTIVVLSNTSETTDKNVGQFSSKILNKVLTENQERFKD